MIAKVSSGDFESLFAQLLDQKIRQGEELNEALVRKCYEVVVSTLSLPKNSADSLHIEDIAAALSGRENEFISLGPQRAQKLIFDLIYLH